MKTIQLHTFEGNLYKGDTLIRSNYCQHHRGIKSAADLKATLRAGSSTDLGGYPLYFITSDGAALSFDSVRKEIRSVLHSTRHGFNDGWQVVACDVNYEDGELYCDHSGERIPSAYAE